MDAGAGPPVRSIGTDPAAFTEFYRAHVDQVTRFVTRRVADPHLAADLTAEVFLAAIEAAAQYRGSSGGPRYCAAASIAARKTSAVRSAARCGSATRRVTNRVTWSTCAR